MKIFHFLLLTAFAAITFSFFSCSSDDGGEPTPSSNSSGGETVFCKQNSGICSQLSLSTCMELVSAGVAQIVSSCDEPPPPSSSSSQELPPPPSSSSNSEGTVFCKQNSGACSQFSLSTCMELVNAGVAQIVSSCDEPSPSQSSSSLSSSSQSSSSQSPPPSSSSSGTWYCDFGPRHTCLTCDNLIGGGCFEISGSNPSAEECDQQWATITQSCATSGDFCDYGPLTIDYDDDCGGTGYCGGCYKYATNCIADGGSRVSTCPASSLELSEVTQTSFTDTRDNKVYKTVVIGTQTWMAENLNYNPSTGNSSCYFNLSSFCNSYGRLYDWSTAMGFNASCNSSSCSSQIQSKHKGICPSGWHIPSNADWEKLYRYVDMENDGNGKLYDEYYDYSYKVGRYLKARNGWDNTQSGVSGNGTDNYGFSALPGGYNGSGDDNFYDFEGVGDSGYWWSTSEVAELNILAYSEMMLSGDESAYHGGIYLKSGLNSVRCLMD